MNSETIIGSDDTSCKLREQAALTDSFLHKRHKKRENSSPHRWADNQTIQSWSKNERSAIDLGNQRTGFFICTNRSHCPMHNFSPFRSMLITHIWIIRFNNDPTFAWARTVQTLERLGAFGERGPTSQELSSGNFVIASFEWPMHEEDHKGSETALIL